MVTIHLSYTSKINKPGDSPVLSIDQIWKGLQRKVRFAQEFVPVIESCTVLEEKEDGTVVRDVKFKEGAGPKPQARETVREYYPSWVSNEFETGCLFVCWSAALTRSRLTLSKKTERIFVMLCLMGRLARSRICT